MMWLHQDEESISYDDSIDDSIPPPPPPFPPPVSRHNSRSTAHIVTRAATVEEELEIRMTPVLERVNRIERGGGSSSKRYNSNATKSSSVVSNPNGNHRMQQSQLRPPLASIDASVANSAETTIGIMNDAGGARLYKPTNTSKTSLRSQTESSSVSTTANKKTNDDNNSDRPDSRTLTVASASSLTYVSVLPEDDDNNNDGEGVEAVSTPSSSSSTVTKDSTTKAGGVNESILPSCCREQRGVLLGISTVLLFLVVLGITIGLTMHLKRNNKDGITSYKSALYALGRNLPPETLLAIKSKITVASSPQKDALFWVLYNDTYFYNDMETPPTIDLKNNEFDEFQFVQRFILATLYMSLDGNNWTNKTNWMTEVDVCHWYGIECFGSTSSLSDGEAAIAAADTNSTVVKNAIRGLILPNNQLHGTLPLEIVGLDKLENMELFNNDIGSTIPPQLLEEMTMLKTLFLDENHITGTLSPMVGNLINLEKLTLNRNQIVGSIPNEIGKLTNLSILWLFENEGITGSLPSVIGQLTNLKSLALFNTGISGTIPDLSNLQKLEVFKVENCDLTGNNGFTSLFDIPSLKVLGLAGNEITGSLDGIHRLVNLEELYISQTLISGPLQQLGNLTQLKYIKASEAALTGAIPASFGNLRKLIEIDLSMNRLTGTIPSELGNLKSLELMDLRNNFFSGTVPDGLCIDGAIIQVELECRNNGN